ADALLAACVGSLLAEGVKELVVVENGDASLARGLLGAAGLDHVEMIETGLNLGYGPGANRGLAATSAAYVLIANPDLEVHRGALSTLSAALDANPRWAVVGPRVLGTDGHPYPSARVFPDPVSGVGHALLGVLFPNNRFTRRYRGSGSAVASEVDWVSGACFLARSDALEEVGGFDEAYFMFAEDMDLCWRLTQAGWSVGFEPEAVVTHHGGTSRRRHPYAMAFAHHRSALRFASLSTKGRSRVMLPGAALVLGARLLVVWAGTFWSSAMRRARPDAQ
ncbi:MAG: glycosyltransferase family 2 protein, partial [Acidimicrobiales bacterium]